jgi:signal transduction histidine kinase
MSTSARRAPELPRGLRRVGAIFTPPESVTESYESLQNVGLHLQLALACAAVGAIWLAPGLETTERVQVMGMLVLFLAYSFTSAKAALRNPLLRLLSFPTDLLALFAFAFVVPATAEVVMFAALLTITFHTYTCGRSAGLILSAGVIALAVGLEVTAPVEHRLEWFTVVLYGVILAVLTLMVDGLARERRREARHLARLHRALRSLAPAPDLETTLRSVSEAVREAVGALFVVVLMQSDDSLDVAALDGIEADTADSAEQRRQARDPRASPSGVALATGRPVVITDIATDQRFSHWAGEALRWGFGAMVVAPLGPPDDPVGVLNTYFAKGQEFAGDDVALIVAYAQQASLVIARAVAYEQQRLAAEQLAEADALKSEFVSTVSHELRTPLTAVRGFVATLLARWDRIDDAERRFLLERVDWNARELSDLIEQVLDFSRIEAGPAPVRLETVELAARLGALVDRLEPALGGAGVNVGVPAGLAVRADVAALDRIVTNLLTNAAKFSPPGSPIDVTARSAAGEVIVSVRDHGSGIALEDQERVFERFYRAGPTAGKRGTGIGLAIVRSYVERLGGRVWLDSAPGEGATFSVALPAADVEARTTEFA